MTVKCQVCCEYLPADHFRVLSCGNSFCKECCLKMHFANDDQDDEDQYDKTKCCTCRLTLQLPALHTDLPNNYVLIDAESRLSDAKQKYETRLGALRVVHQAELDTLENDYQQAAEAQRLQWRKDKHEERRRKKARMCEASTSNS